MVGFSAVAQASTSDVGPAMVERSSSGSTGSTSNGAGGGKGGRAAAAVVLPACSPQVAQLMQAPDLAPVKTFVSGALLAKLRGNTVNYRHLVDAIRTKDDLETLPRVFLALSSCITTVTSDPDRFKELLAVLFKYDWGGGLVVMETFTDLLAHLVSAKSTFLHPTLQMLARSLASAGPLGAAATLAVGQPGTAGASHVDVTVVDAASDAARERKDAIHRAIRLVLALVPAGVPELYPALEAAFPHRRVVGAGSLVHYARELLRVAEYLPGLRERLLALLVERCLEIDVEIKIDDAGEARVQEGAAEGHEALVVSEHVFVGFDDPAIQVHLDGDGGQQQQQEQAQEQEAEAPEVVVDEMAEKLDSVMLHLFEFLEGQLVGRGGSGDGERAGAADGTPAVRLFEGLVPTLEGPILATHHCKYVQFLLFFLAARDPARVVPGLLLDRLLAVVLHDRAPAVARHAALAYAASYLVRARALRPADMVRALMALIGAAELHLERAAPDVNMLRLVGDLLREEEEEEEEDEEEEGQDWQGEGQGGYEEGDAEGEGEEEEAAPTAWGARGRHGLFYAICQAVFYVVAFHHSTAGGEDLLGVSTDAAGQGSLGEEQRRLRVQLGRLACCPLRPLDKCLESVKREFLRLARCHSLVPAGALAGLGSEDPHQHQHHQLLESFFPFDPYVLRRSSRFVATPDVYRYWQALPQKEGPGRCAQGSDGEQPNEEAGWCASDSDSSDDDSSSDDSNDSSTSDESSSGSSSDEGEGEEEGPEDAFRGEETAIAMSVASVASAGGLLQVGAAFLRSSSSSSGGGRASGRKRGRKAGRRKRERADSMEFDDDDDDEGHVGGGGESSAGALLHDLAASASHFSPAFASASSTGSITPSCSGSEDESHARRDPDGGGAQERWVAAEVAAACGAALAYGSGKRSPRVRKESVSSVGSW